MQKIISALTLFAFLFCSTMPCLASDKNLRQKIQKAMDDHVCLEVTTSHDAKHLGYVVAVAEEAFSLQNPVTDLKEDLNWGNVKEVNAIKGLGKESKAKIDSFVGKDRVVRIELLDKSKLQGKVAQVAEDSFVLQDPKTAAQETIRYEQVKKVDDEPSGQKVIRKVMIGVGVGLLATLLIVSALLAGD